MKAIIFTVLIFGQACVSHLPSRSLSPCDAKLRAVIDMGSGTTKLNLAEVHTCSGAVRIKDKIAQDNSRAVPLEASKFASGEISADAMNAAVVTLKEMREVVKLWAQEHKYADFDLTVVGTHALRTAANKEEFIRRIEAAGFFVRALTQEQEGQAGFEAVLATPLPEGCAKEDVLVWDVGGGSTQFTRFNQNGNKTANFALGSENFRKSLLKFRRPSPDPSCPQYPDSPNPLGKSNLATARAMVAKAAPVTSAQLDSKKACVIGISGVHAKAVTAQIQKNWNKVGPCSCGLQPNCLPTPDGYSKKELQCLAELFAEKNDCAAEIKGPYAHVAESSLAMVLGFMDQLGIERVHVKNINVGEYFLADQNLLKFKTESAH